MDLLVSMTCLDFRMFRGRMIENIFIRLSEHLKAQTVNNYS